MKIGTLKQQRAVNVQASLRICAESPDPSLLAYTKYCRVSLRLKIRLLLGWIRQHDASVYMQY